jgi:hypothetical protein
MKTVTVDPQRRVRLGGEAPATKFWLIPKADGYDLRRIPKPEEEKRPTYEEALQMIRTHRFRLTAAWEEIRKATREID